jgi:gentisate 1,2-dioxygenase
VTKATPYLWRYDEARPLLLESARVITAEEAERRVLILENPGMAGAHSLTETLYGGLQLIMPGEVAPAHRHSPAALRFILEGEGAYTAVNGERAYMRPGDFVITPSWSWHDHGHEGTGPMVWLDGLDVPLVRALGTVFSEGYGEQQFPTNRPPGHSYGAFGHNMRPVGARPQGRNSPVFSYPFAATRAALDALAAGTDPDPARGFVMEYINPATGGPAMPTMSTYMTLLPKAFSTKARRTTEAQLFSVVEGTGTAVVETASGEVSLDFGPRDHFLVPMWMAHRIAADSEVLLFSFSDRATQEALGLYREAA